MTLDFADIMGDISFLPLLLIILYSVLWKEPVMRHCYAWWSFPCVFYFIFYLLHSVEEPGLWHCYAWCSFPVFSPLCLALWKEPVILRCYVWWSFPCGFCNIFSS
ncbi:uncharacterized protein EV420DRAFT_1500420, partial [Desarmillaria tabescens]